MREKTCPLGDKVVNSLRRNQIDPEIEEHIAECSVCAEVMFVHDWMNQYKQVSWDTEAAEKKLPGPEEMWNSSHLRRRRDKKFVKRALRPVIYSQIFAAAALAVVGVFFVLANLPGLRNVLRSEPVVVSIVQPLTQVLKAAPSWLPLVFIPMAIVLVSIGFISMLSAFEDKKHRLT